MTPRAYFAAHAPHEIPKWFEPSGLMALPPVPQVADDITAQAQLLAVSWRRDPTFDLVDYAAQESTSPTGCLRDLTDVDLNALTDFEVACKTYDEAVIERRQQRERQRLAQWPWAWADLVLAAGGVQ